jgi:hypothetical protein
VYGGRSSSGCVEFTQAPAGSSSSVSPGVQGVAACGRSSGTWACTTPSSCGTHRRRVLQRQGQSFYPGTGGLIGGWRCRWTTSGASGSCSSASMSAPPQAAHGVEQRDREAGRPYWKARWMRRAAHDPATLASTEGVRYMHWTTPPTTGPIRPSSRWIATSTSGSNTSIRNRRTRC